MSKLSPETDCQCKVGRGLDTFGLEDVNQELVGRWRGDSRDRQSLRELSEYFNRQLLAAELERAGNVPLDGEAANIYRLLTDEEVSSGVRTQTRRRLQAAGVDVELTERQFVSHQTIHSHLTDCLDVSREADPPDPDARRDTDRDRIRALQRRTEAVTVDALDRLVEDDALALEAFDVLIDVTVLCDNCGRQHDVGDLLAAGGCACREPDSE